MGLFSSDDVGTISAVGFGRTLGRIFDSASKPDLDLDEKRRLLCVCLYCLIHKKRRQMNAMIEKQNKKMKNLSLNDKYKLDDSKEFFAKLGKEKRWKEWICFLYKIMK